ncbi:MAG: hypothetical protein KQH83_08175 [Actinobacteria bacterium]|nr:hypothetical protein [Actinomycetota bacterium]
MTSPGPAPPEAEPEPEPGPASRIPLWGRAAAAAVLAGAVVGIVLAVSGGSPEPAAGESVVVEPLEADVLGVVDAIAGRLGDEPGLLATAYALDRGYDAAQITGGASAGTLLADGTIAGATPVLPAAGVFSDLPDAAASPGVQAVLAAWHAADGPIAPITSDQWTWGVATEFEAILDGRATPSAPSVATQPSPELTWAGFATGVIATLADQGYSADQILLGIVAGEVRLDSVGTGTGPVGCWFLQAQDGTVVAPERSLIGGFGSTKPCREGLIDPSLAAATSTTAGPPEPGGPATTTSLPAAATTIATTTTTIPPFPLPMTFAGPGTLTISFSFTSGSCTQGDQFVEVTLHPDGTATGTMYYIAPGFTGFLKHTDGTFTLGECTGPGTESEVPLVGTHTPPAGPDERGRVFLDGQVFLASTPIRLLEGTYDAEDMTLAYRFDAFMEAFAENTDVADPRSYGDYDFPLMVPVEED